MFIVCNNMKKNVLLLCAHSDDQVLGAGGTVAKLHEEGYYITTVVFSFGEKSHIWMKKEYIQETRVKESEDAGKFLGSDETVFMGIPEGKFRSFLSKKENKQKIIDIIKKSDPSIIFTHSVDDPHLDHKQLYNFIIKLYDEMNLECSMYMFDIWTFFSYRKRHYPSIYIDVSAHFKKKLQALDYFKSQKLYLFTLLWSMYSKAILNGLKVGHKYVERFHKVK